MILHGSFEARPLARLVFNFDNNDLALTREVGSRLGATSHTVTWLDQRTLWAHVALKAPLKKAGVWRSVPGGSPNGYQT